MFGLYHYPEIYRDNRRISRSLERLRLAKARQVSTGLMYAFFAFLNNSIRENYL